MKKISSFTLDEKTLTVFCEVADKFCINKSKLIERLIKEWLKKHKEENDKK